MRFVLKVPNVPLFGILWCTINNPFAILDHILAGNHVFTTPLSIFVCTLILLYFILLCLTSVLSIHNPWRLCLCSSNVQVKFYMERTLFTHWETTFLIRRLHMCDSFRYRYLVEAASCVSSPEALFPWTSLTGPPHSCGTWQLTWLFPVIFGRVILSHNAYLCYHRFRSVESQCLSYFIGNTETEVKEAQSPNKWFTHICCLKGL